MWLLKPLIMKPWLIFIQAFGCEPLYTSEELTFLAFDEEHHRVAIANTSGVFKNLRFIPKTIMRIKNWMNRSKKNYLRLFWLGSYFLQIESKRQ